MREGQPKLVRREDYAPPPFWIRSVDLTFDLDPAKTIVHSKMAIERNPGRPLEPLRLHGEALLLLRVLIDGDSVAFRHEDGELVIDNPPLRPTFTLEIRNTYDGREAFVIRSEEKRLLLLGATDMGASHAAMRLLEHLGCRWFFPAREWEIVPLMPSDASSNVPLTWWASHRFCSGSRSAAKSGSATNL